MTAPGPVVAFAAWLAAAVEVQAAHARRISAEVELVEARDYVAEPPPRISVLAATADRARLRHEEAVTAASDAQAAYERAITATVRGVAQ